MKDHKFAAKFDCLTDIEFVAICKEFNQILRNDDILGRKKKLGHQTNVNHR